MNDEIYQRDKEAREQEEWGNLEEARMTDITKCPKCGGVADNGTDRSFPPSPYLCSRCTRDAAWCDVLAADADEAMEIVLRERRARIESLESALVEIQCCVDEASPLWNYCEDALAGMNPRPLSWSQEMAAERDALRAENEKLELLLKGAIQRGGELVAENERLKERVARLEAAEPFWCKEFRFDPPEEKNKP